MQRLVCVCGALGRSPARNYFFEGLFGHYAPLKPRNVAGQPSCPASTTPGASPTSASCTTCPCHRSCPSLHDATGLGPAHRGDTHRGIRMVGGGGPADRGTPAAACTLKACHTPVPRAPTNLAAWAGNAGNARSQCPRSAVRVDAGAPAGATGPGCPPGCPGCPGSEASHALPRPTTSKETSPSKVSQPRQLPVRVSPSHMQHPGPTGPTHTHTHTHHTSAPPDTPVDLHAPWGGGAGVVRWLARMRSDHPRACARGQWERASKNARHANTPRRRLESEKANCTPTYSSAASAPWLRWDSRWTRD
jgi:hypothetical protein